MDSRRKTEQDLQVGGAVAWLIAALLICYWAVSLGIGRANEPQSGFVFFWSGLIMAVLALALFASSVRADFAAEVHSAGFAWRKILAVLAALVVYGILLDKLGFLFSSFLLFIFLARIAGAPRWPPLIVIAGATALSSFVLFDLWLKIRLPKGVFRF